MRDHGAEPVLDFASGDLESKVESIIRELQNAIKDSIPEGGRFERLSFARPNDRLSRNGNVLELGDEFDSTHTRR